ncbi:hypothetical protein K2173_026488 [Erythroxylum novogranatense]|uniref:Acyl-activating enzyme 19 n=1 Tax=Erythroxylum novogranatense TaxID=1862640 RepID=A0AAV8TWD6_9ROSI|nr:hypothetical protein K2173_026488 [Erythroxylum novogranatense]
MSSKQQHCCISHLFFQAATDNPRKIAVIHPPPSTPAVVTPRKLTNTTHGDGVNGPAFYEGDECFAFSEVLKSVDSLTIRLRSILDGAASNDPFLLTPQSISGKTDLKSSIYYKQGLEQSLSKPRIVGIYMPPSVEYIIAVLSVLRCGEAFLPLDPCWPKDRILSILSSSDAHLVITCELSFVRGGYDAVSISKGLDQFDYCPVLNFSIQDSFQHCTGPLDLVWPCEKVKKRIFCYIMYTSGSTGKPKGVCGTEQGLLNRFQWMHEFYPFHVEEVLLFKTSISFVDHLQEFLGAMLTPCSLVIPPFNELRVHPFSIINFLEAYSITRFITVPSLMRMILPTLESKHETQIPYSLKVLVLSGEVFPLSLWHRLSNLLPRTSILNLYGSTEVSGDCTYFDCKMLPMILEAQELTSVPIGVPITNCEVILVGESDTQGEMHVSGPCVSNAHIYESDGMDHDFVKMHKNLKICNCLVGDCGSQVYHKTGDFARRLPCGNLLFLGRTDRIIKVNGQRLSLDEIENALDGHPGVMDAAVVYHKSPEEISLLEAFLVLKDKRNFGDFARSSIRSWLMSKVPLAMIPSRFVLVESLPISLSGKIDYAFLASSSLVEDKTSDTMTSDLLQTIKKAFCDTLLVQEVSDDLDFFIMGGDSISAAHLCYNLGIDMRMIYNFHTPTKLHIALIDQKDSYRTDVNTYGTLKSDLKADNRDMLEAVSFTSPDLLSLESHKWSLKKSHEKSEEHAIHSKRFKGDTEKHNPSKCVATMNGCTWSVSVPMSCSFSRCNKVLYGGKSRLGNECQVIRLTEHSKSRTDPCMRELWKVDMESCVDASPLVVLKDQDAYLFVGSHAQKFVCINVKSGSVQWEAKLEGRIECSAAIAGDFSQVVVGCYRGKIYFLDFFSGNVCWIFETSGQVKSQPYVDLCRKLIWCGSHDHNLYALDYENHLCIYKLPCGGSVYGSPAVDEVHDVLYVASTSGRVTAVLIKDRPFCTLWKHELGVPVFGSLSLSPYGNVVCCLVDGNVVMLDMSGSILWKVCSLFSGGSLIMSLGQRALNYGMWVARSLMFTMNVPKPYWGDAVLVAAYLINRMPLKTLNFRAPLEGKITLLIVYVDDIVMTEMIKKKWLSLIWRSSFVFCAYLKSPQERSSFL